MNKRKVFLLFVARHAVAIALSFMFLAPVVFLAPTSLMSSDQTLASQLWPRDRHPANYLEAFKKAPFGRYLLNTVLYAGLATAFMLLASVPAAYGLAKLRWRGRNLTIGPCPLGLAGFRSIVVLFFFAQKAFVEGVTLTGVKG